MYIKNYLATFLYIDILSIKVACCGNSGSPFIAAALDDGTVQIWDMRATATEITKLQAHTVC